MESTVSYLLMLQNYTSSKQKDPEIKYYTLPLDRNINSKQKTLKYKIIHCP